MSSAGAGLTSVTAATAALAASQETATATTLGLASAAQVENSALGRQAVILETAAVATDAKGAADVRAAAAARSHAVAQGQIEKAAVASTAGMLGLRGAVLTAGTAFIAATVGFQALGKAIGSAISFERELNVFQVTAGATADQMERVTEVARELGRDITLPGVAANDAAQALQLLARAGLSVEDSIDAVRGTLQLATAAEIDNAKAVELVANAVNSFKLSGDEASRVADLLAGAAAASQGSIEDMGLALRQTSAIAAGLGISIEDTVTILTQLARAGLSASDAGTSFRQTLLRLIQDLPKVEKEVERLGLDLRDISGNIRPEVFEELGRKLQKLTPAARQLAIANLGGADAIRTLLILTRAQAGEFDAIEASITRVGIAQEQAAARTEGLGGATEAAKNEFADLGLTIGQVASGPLQVVVTAAGQAAGAINDLGAAVERVGGSGGFLSEFNKVVSDFAGSFSRLNLSFQQGVRAAQAVGEEFKILPRITEGATDAIEGLTSALNEMAAASRKRVSTPDDQGTGVQGILNRVSGFDTAETAARIRGNTNELLGVLQSEQSFLEQQLGRAFVRRRQALFNQLQSQLLGVTNDIAAITERNAIEIKKTAAEAAKDQREADQSLLDALSNRRGDAERKAAAARTTEGLSDDIRAQDRIQALIKIQIAKIKAQVKDEKLRKAAIRELRIALIESRREEEELRQQRIQEAQDRQDTIQNLNIQIAQERGNENAIRKAINTRLKTLDAQIKAARGDAVKVRELILERERLRNELKDLNEAQKKVNKARQQAEFEFRQAQQGFAANLFGNLIPSGATGGLVGNVSASPQGPIDLGIERATALQTGKLGTNPTAGQANATNQLLLQILRAIQAANRSGDSPEAIYQRRVGSAVGDGSGNGSLDSVQ